MSIPDTPESRIENYLGVLIGQETAQKPETPGSRVESYLEEILNQSGGGSDSIVLSATDNPAQKFKITVDTDGKLTVERIE